MSERNVLDTPRMEDAVAALRDLGDKAGAPKRLETPRPDFRKFGASLNQHIEHRGLPDPEQENGRLKLTQSYALALATSPGIRGIARIPIQTRSGTIEMITGPAILLADCQRLAVLAGEGQTATITEDQQALLEAEYVKDLAGASVSAEHSDNDIPRANLIAPALIAISTPKAVQAHGDMHRLAGTNPYNTFSRRFAADGRRSRSDYGRQDIRIDGTQTRRVIPAIGPLNHGLTTFYTAPADQVEPDRQLLITVPRTEIPLAASELAIATTAAASISQYGTVPDLQANINYMIGQ